MALDDAAVHVQHARLLILRLVEHGIGVEAELAELERAAVVDVDPYEVVRAGRAIDVGPVAVQEKLRVRTVHRYISLAAGSAAAQAHIAIRCGGGGLPHAVRYVEIAPAAVETGDLYDLIELRRAAIDMRHAGIVAAEHKDVGAQRAARLLQVSIVGGADAGREMALGSLLADVEIAAIGKVDRAESRAIGELRAAAHDDLVGDGTTVLDFEDAPVLMAHPDRAAAESRHAVSRRVIRLGDIVHGAPRRVRDDETRIAM